MLRRTAALRPYNRKYVSSGAEGRDFHDSFELAGAGDVLTDSITDAQIVLLGFAVLHFLKGSPKWFYSTRCGT